MNTRSFHLILGIILVSILGLPHTSWTKNNQKELASAKTLTTRGAQEASPRVNSRALRQNRSSNQPGVRNQQRITPQKQSPAPGQNKSTSTPRVSQKKQTGPSQSLPQNSRPELSKKRGASSSSQPKISGQEKKSTTAKTINPKGSAKSITPSQRSKQPMNAQRQNQSPEKNKSAITQRGSQKKQLSPSSRPKTSGEKEQHKHKAVHQEKKRPTPKITSPNRGPHHTSLTHRPGRKTVQVRHVYHHLPAKHKIIHHQNRRYHLHHGRYYWPTSLGFVLVRPPIGLVIFNLPIGYRTVISAGLTYYVHGDIYYRRVATGYEVVRPVRVISQDYLDQVMVSMDLLNVRYGPNQDEEIIAQITAGTVLNVLGAAPDWLYIELPDEDLQGWVMRDYVQDFKAGQLAVDRL